MHRCSNHVGCLSVSANRIGKGIVVKSSRIGDGISISTNRIGKGLIVDCSIICTVNKDSYLFVSPTFVWLTQDMLSSGEFDIKSNTSWNID